MEDLYKEKFMCKKLFCIVIGFVLMALASGNLFSQTAEQKRLLEEYLKNRKQLKELQKQDTVISSESRIYEPVKIEAPPEKPAWLDSSQRRGETERFGMGLFAHPPESFVSSTEIPVPGDYVLGPGDHIIVNLWGHADQSYELVIDREGKVFIPRAGELVLWGLSLDEAEERIRDLLENIYSDFKLNVILGKIRSITVYVSGEVKRPGAYTVSSLYTLFNTLYLSGGPTDRGSMRDIRLIRGGKIIKRVDLYKMLIEGRSDDERLESNDIIFVPVVGPLVKITGEVKRPGIYELRGGERVLDAINLAGGVRSSAYLGNIELYRYDRNRRRILITLDLSEPDASASNVELVDGDELRIGKVHALTENVVYLSGAVKYPGEYQYRRGMKVSDLVRKDILMPHAYLHRAFLIRTFEDNSRKVYPLNLEKILNIESEEVHYSWESKIDFNDSCIIDTTVLVKDIELRPWDRIEVFSFDRMRDKYSVRIDGEIRKPGRYDYALDMTLSDLVYLAGGVKRSAYLLNAEIARLDSDTTRISKVMKVNLKLALERPHTKDDPVLKPQDAVFIREIPNYKDHEVVWIGGEVVFPGSYVLDKKGETLKDLIIRAGGFTDRAFLKGAIFIRQNVAQDLENRDILDVVTSLQQIYSDSLGIVKKEIMPIDINPSKMNRIVIDLPSIMSDEDSQEDIVLRDGDRIFIPRYPSGVSVIGAVASSGTIKFMRGKNAKYYIERAGGFTKRSARNEIRIIKANGSVVKKNAIRTEVELGDVIVVPSKIEKERDWLKIFQTTMSILSSALTAVYIVTKL